VTDDRQTTDRQTDNLIDKYCLYCMINDAHHFNIRLSFREKPSQIHNFLGRVNYKYGNWSPESV